MKNKDYLFILSFCLLIRLILINFTLMKSIYPTQIIEPSSPPLKSVFQRFNSRLDSKIKGTIVLKKTLLAKQSSEYLEKLQKIKEQSGQYQQKLQQQQKWFQLQVEGRMRNQIDKWTDYQKFFKGGFEKLQESLKLHRNRNLQYGKRIRAKKIELKEMMRGEKYGSSRMQELLKKAEEGSDRTTKQSTVRLTYSNSHRPQRIKTQSSLPTLKPSQYQRIRTIPYEQDEQQLRTRRACSYMEPIGTLRTTQHSALPLLTELLFWYRSHASKQQSDNWFLKVLFNERNFNKLLQYLTENSASRKVSRRL